VTESGVGARAPTEHLGDGRIRVGVVGVGAFGRHHARHYALQPGAELTAIADTDMARARQVAADLGGEAFADHRALIGRVDAVSIAVPASRHAEIAGVFVDAGVHVLVEKPIATDSAAARALIRRAAQGGAILQVGHVERFSPAVRALRQRVGNPRRIASVRRAPWSPRAVDVDVVLDLMIHDIDHMLALAGAPVAMVAASGQAVRSALTDEAEAWVTFTNGVVATLSASRVAERPERRLTVTEPGIMFSADLAAPSLTITGRGRPVAVAEAELDDSGDNLGAEIAAFLDSILTGAPPAVDGGAGLAALEVAERIQASVAEAAAPVRWSI